MGIALHGVVGCVNASAVWGKLTEFATTGAMEADKRRAEMSGNWVMRLLSLLLRASAFALPIAMALSLIPRAATGAPSGYKIAAAAFMFSVACWLGRFQWRRSLDLEAVFFNARVLPSDPVDTKLTADIVSLAAGIFLVAAVVKVF